MLDEPSEYCIGQVRWISKTDDKFKKAVQKFQNGFAITMTKVASIARSQTGMLVGWSF